MVALVKRAKVPPDFLSSFYAFMFLPTEQPRYPAIHTVPPRFFQMSAIFSHLYLLPELLIIWLKPNQGLRRRPFYG